MARVATLRSHKSSYDERSAAQRVVNIPSVRPRRQVGLSMAFSVTGPREEPVVSRSIGRQVNTFNYMLFKKHL